MNKPSPKLGDVISIPFEGKVAYAKVIWISDKFEDTFGFVTFKSSFEDELNLESTDYLEIAIYSGTIKVLYGDLKNIEDGRWIITDKAPVHESDKALLFHNIGGELWHGDKFHRVLSIEEYKEYPKFLRAGNKAIENMLSVGCS